MVMTEKQGGSDLRANTHPVAEPAGDGWYELTGHKWFCTHPVFDVFLTLAQAPGGITCFVAERPHPGFRLQRLKDKLGGRCLASSEVEYARLPARILGEEGRGTAFMIEQIVWTRLDTLLGVAGIDAPCRGRGHLARPPPLRLRRAAGAAAGDAQRARRPRARVRGHAGGGDADRARLRQRRPARGRLPPPGAGGHEVLGVQARRAHRRPRRSSAWAATATSRRRRWPSCTATSRSAPSGRARATSSPSTCCARCAATPRACRR